MPKIIDEDSVFRTVIDRWVSHGYEGATTKEIAEPAGVNEVTLFRKYGSKAELFEKAIHHQLADTPLNKLLYTGELEADLIAIVEAYLKTNELYGEIIPTILAEAPRHPELKGAFQTPWKNIQVVAKILQKYQAQGLLKRRIPAYQPERFDRPPDDRPDDPARRSRHPGSGNGCERTRGGLFARQETIKGWARPPPPTSFRFLCNLWIQQYK